MKKISLFLVLVGFVMVVCASFAHSAALSFESEDGPVRLTNGFSSAGFIFLFCGIAIAAALLTKVDLGKYINIVYKYFVFNLAFAVLVFLVLLSFLDLGDPHYATPEYEEIAYYFLDILGSVFFWGILCIIESAMITIAIFKPKKSEA